MTDKPRPGPEPKRPEDFEGVPDDERLDVPSTDDSVPEESS